ncbi:hypothetical protein PVAP13_1KG359177 [Panicum virgatum]|uniref:Uncharacterized protein n=1 Tax=Panicum virgatum TaxID=38727 RepID=A0A8T0X2H2_PANVG|nr:hypothetical protein PVAP13_1KG359177 [Panicum virgatum]KAG2655763.1 hypothetical protein PVAP13_1KG359177 [Panicum virgatum]
MEKWTAPHLAPLCTAAVACDAFILHPVGPGRRRRLDPVPTPLRPRRRRCPDAATDATASHPPTRLPTPLQVSPRSGLLPLPLHRIAGDLRPYSPGLRATPLKMRSDGFLEESGKTRRLRKSLEEMADVRSKDLLKECGLPVIALALEAAPEDSSDNRWFWVEVKQLSKCLVLDLDAGLEHALLF